ncbi:hypothetical protein DL89DRAFT_282210 [Linderina pennispora]|uniref:Uncharacterized protein n=1 Tax=Linderina pennispora TaxID=61395 RepID=A0A1Y1WEU7_9FUNG|nr:uncharacterized protein DL89DRAFT_282210 [Linderina pennispora]ORX72061.1 hypothetical protein DL89DRAFT_282210 [Linderina pennispora]
MPTSLNFRRVHPETCQLGQHCHMYHVDKDIELIGVGTKQEAVEHETANSPLSFAYEKDHFLIYNSPEGAIKGNYSSWNSIAKHLSNTNIQYWHSCIREHNGRKVYIGSPILHLLQSGVTFGDHSHPVVNNTAVTFYTTINFEQFAQTTKKIARCHQEFFVIAHDNDFECAETDLERPSLYCKAHGIWPTFERTILSSAYQTGNSSPKITSETSNLMANRIPSEDHNDGSGDGGNDHSNYEPEYKEINDELQIFDDTF